MTQGIHIVFAGGGTAGHLFPGLAVADRLRADGRRARITFAGSGRAFESRHVEASGFEYLTLPGRPAPQRAAEAIGFLLESVAGYFAARRFLAEEHVDLVVGLGGYASVAMGRAARSARLPLVLLEQNAVPGRATRFLARKATAVCLAMNEATASLPRGPQVHLTGNPLRGRFLPAWAGNRQIVVLGGSGGARSLNQDVPKALYRLRNELSEWRIVHQTGETDGGATQTLYRKLGIAAETKPFIEDMPGTLAMSAIAVCRAGGATLAELAAAELPAILVPYPHATDDHQLRNAEVFAEAGGAVIVDERDSGRFDQRLASELSELIDARGRRERMAWNLRRLACPAAAENVVAVLDEVLAASCPRLLRVG